MKNKIFSLFGLAVLTLLVLTSFASATVTLSATTPATLSQSSGSFTIDVTTDTAETVALTATTITDGYGKTLTFTPTSQIFGAAGTSTVTMAYTIALGFNFEMKQYATTLTADGTVSANATSTLTFAQTDFCAWDANGLTSTTADLKVIVKDIRVANGFGSDNEWYPQDDIEVDVRVENNNNNDKIRNIVLEWGLFNKKTGKWTIEVSDEKDFDLKDGDEKIVTLKFKLDNMDEDLSDLDNGDFVFYARAKGDVDEDAGDRAVCSSASDTTTIAIESDFVILSDVQLPETNACGSQTQVTADVWNIGDSDQTDVYVVLYNKELGINQKVTIGDVDKFDNVKLDVLVNVPQNVEEKSYALTMSVYNEDSQVFQNSNDDYSKAEYTLKVFGSCSNLPLASVAANLQSEAKAGQELIVKATVANTGSVQKTFGIELTGYEDWATLVSVDKTTLDLKSKATGDVLVTLKVNKDVSGEKSFNLLVKDGVKILSQPVTATFEKSSILSTLTGLVTGAGDNLYLWGIGALNLVLVLVIIFVAIKVVKKKK